MYSLFGAEQVSFQVLPPGLLPSRIRELGKTEANRGPDSELEELDVSH